MNIYDAALESLDEIRRLLARAESLSPSPTARIRFVAAEDEVSQAIVMLSYHRQQTISDAFEVCRRELNHER